MTSQGGNRGRPVTQAESKLWRAVLADVTPLPGRKPPPEDEPVPQPVVSAAPPATPPPVAARPVLPARPAHTPVLHHGHTVGIDRRTADRLKRGEMEIEARIDLHGLTQEAAHVALNSFLSRSYGAGRRCVLVITGKGLREGTGVLRAAVPRWLNDSPLRSIILCFAHARPPDGGEGALYVLLKRQR